jgi:peptidoglycan-associated lipoprotein
MYNFMKLTTSWLLVALCVGMGGCGKKTDVPSDDETTTQIGDEFTDPNRPDGPGVDQPDVPVVIEDEFFGNETNGGAAAFTDPSQDLFEPVYFGFDQSALSGEERLKVERVANYLSSNSGSTVIVEGHCDWKGTSEYNISLGERRASAVKQFLIAMGVHANRITVTSQGDLEATENGGNSSMAKDRRARFIVQQG